jgi:distribution and morphology protein 31
VARTISNYLTSETGATVVFESAIVPKWKDSRISFKNVYISRRPKSQTPKLIREHGHRAVARMDVGDHPATYHDPIDDEEEVVQPSPDEDTNYSMFDLDVDSVDVTLSLWRWLDGKGLVSSAEIKGVRGVVGKTSLSHSHCNDSYTNFIDRRNVHYDPDKPLNPADFRHQARPGDFELESLKLEDVLVTIYQPGDFRPYTASIFQADLRCLRKQWFIYDFLSAENIVGQVDNCLFSLHKPQSIGRTMEDDMKDGLWKRMVCCLIIRRNAQLIRFHTVSFPDRWRQH